MVGQSYLRAMPAAWCGEIYCAGTSSGRDCEMSQFWQNLQFTLHPAVAIEKAFVPGR